LWIADCGLDESGGAGAAASCGSEGAGKLPAPSGGSPDPPSASSPGWRRILPGEDGFAFVSVLKAGVELSANVAGQAGDFADAGHK
jgi:hypothetical protein